MKLELFLKDEKHEKGGIKLISDTRGAYNGDKYKNLKIPCHFSEIHVQEFTLHGYFNGSLPMNLPHVAREANTVCVVASQSHLVCLFLTNTANDIAFTL